MYQLLDLKFKTETERNAYAFENRDFLIKNLEDKEVSSIMWGIFLGFFVGIFVGILSSSWILFFIFLIGLPWFLSNQKSSEIKKVNEFSEQYKNFLDEIEKDVREILLKFSRRYSLENLEIEQISNLTNLINHKKNLNLTKKATLHILIKNKKELTINLFDKEISKLENKSSKSLAKFLVNYFYEIDFENEEEYEDILEQLFECLNRKGIKYDIDELKNELIVNYKLMKANEFEEKLSRNPDNKISVKEIEHLNGFEFEELIGKLFRKMNYKVKVTKKSGDQGADLIIEKDGISTAVQTKKYAKNVGNTAVQEVVAAMKYYDCDKSMVITTGSFTKGAIELANKNKVQLVDKKKLDSLFDSFL